MAKFVHMTILGYDRLLGTKYHVLRLCLHVELETGEFQSLVVLH
jgi:hypothetical protein